ncbi:MAG: hypothetical protein ACI9EW_001530 [Cellvibrionaceae bacterium]|jgi:hypothetical protein
MFKSKVRPIVIPQFEHARLAAKLASMWGNADFDRPEIDFTPFVDGVALHDWQYSNADNLSIGDISEAEWLAVMRHGIDLEFANPIIEAIAKLHMMRLVRTPTSPERKKIVEAFENRISKAVAQSGFSRDHFEWADRITRFCDMVAFDFSFERPTKGSTPISAKINQPNETQLTYEIKPNGEIKIDPWPFSAPSFSGMITGYQLDGYPETLTPLIIHYQVTPTIRSHP